VDRGGQLLGLPAAAAERGEVLTVEGQLQRRHPVVIARGQLHRRNIVGSRGGEAADSDAGAGHGDRAAGQPLEHRPPGEVAVGRVAFRHMVHLHSFSIT
jgi:hypothetical protein